MTAVVVVAMVARRQTSPQNLCQPKKNEKP